MEVTDWASVVSDDSETQLQDLNDEELYYASGHIPKIQFRKDISRACWNEELGMAEVLENKGQMWKTTGVVRNGKIYCLLEETLFLAEIGALLILDATGCPLSLKDIYEKVAEGRSGCSWESVQVYRHLKTLGYIAGRHGEPWTIKGRGREICSVSVEGAPVTNVTRNSESEDKGWIAGLFNNLNIKEVNPVFDVYLPNSKFRKSSPGNPSFVLCLTRDRPPSKAEIECLEGQCNGIPLKFCHLEDGRVSFFSFNSVELPILP